MNGCVLYLPLYAYGANAQKAWDMSGQGNHGAISGSIPSSYPMLQPIASGSVTQANMRISSFAGTAFVDFSSAGTLTPYPNHLVVIKDSVGKAIQGYIKAAGTGETLGSNLLASWTNQNYETFTSAGPDITSAIEATTNGDAYDTQPALNQFKLYLLSCTLTLSSGENPQVYVGNTWHSYNGGLGLTTLNAGANNLYFNATALAFYTIIQNTSATNFSATFLLKQVLTPSATGVTISSTKGGTENWESKDANFDYNDTSGYTYVIYQVSGHRGHGWFADQVDDRIVHSSLNLGTIHTLHYWLLYRGFAGVIHGGAVNYHGLRLTPTACSYNIGNTAVTVTHSAAHGIPVLFSIDRNGTSVDFYKNGVKIGTTQTLGANTAQVLTDFFRYSDSTIYWGGTIFESLAFNSNMGAQAIRNYFELSRSRYGV